MKQFYATSLAFKKYELVLTAILFAVTSFAQPLISSISPASGFAGSAITIEGENFNSTPGNNVVYFGAVKATVSAANSTSITAIVPSGATYAPVSVTTGGLTAYSPQFFSIGFINVGNLDAKSFPGKLDYGTSYLHKSICLSDIDNDGRSDIILSSSSAPGKISVFKNQSTKDNISFATKTDYNVNTLPKSIKSADLNGDGKLDIVCVNDSSNNLSILRNTTIGSTISFATKIDYATGSKPANVAVADFNIDGKPDLIVANGGVATVSIFKNQSISGTISFAAKVDNVLSKIPFGVAVADFDGDGMTDFVVTNGTASNTISAFHNISSDGDIAFESNIDFGTGSNPRAICTGDVDGDGKSDIVVANYNSNTVSVLLNKSTPGVISFKQKNDYVTGQGTADITLTDIDGDSKPDILIANGGTSTDQYDSDKISVLQNFSSEGSAFFEQKIDYLTGRFPVAIVAGDLNGDSKPDIIAANSFYSNTVSVLRNKIGEIITLCPPLASLYLVSDKEGAVYKWQVNTGSSFVNINDNINYSGTNTVELNLVNTPSSWYGYQYRCVVDGANSIVYTLQFATTWIGNESGDWENPNNWSCGAVPDAYTDVIVNESGFVQIYSNVFCRSLLLNRLSTLRINDGFSLTITH